MQRSNKHQMQQVTLSPLSGGINVAVPPEQIDETDMQECQNMWYERDTQRLVGRGGLRLVGTYDSSIKSLHYDIESNTSFIFLSNGDGYCVTLADTESNKRNIGKLAGTGKVHCCKFGSDLFVVSGDVIQYYEFNANSKLTAVENSPKADLIFYRFGRLAVAKAGNSSRITFSSTGDAKSNVAWTENSADQSYSQWLDVGDKDNGYIMDVVPLATDMIIFKSSGRCWQLVGDKDPDSWQVYTAASMTDLTTQFTAGACATNIGNEVVFLSLRGLKALSATQDYGNIAASEIGDKFNRLITRSQYMPELYDMRRHKTLMIRSTTDKTTWVAYNYALNAATVMKFAVPVEAILETKDDVYVAAGNKLYQWTDEATTDDGVAIDYIVKPRDIISSDEILVKAIDTKLSSDHAGTATVFVGDRLKVNMPTNSRRKVRCNHSTDCISLSLESTSRFELDHIALDIVAL